ncbi:hypothetical protein M0R45_008124 [Rubus argutus]|uniref:Secreted protein n=1 Tax=Rubus argutus TaxID=59490 RepID=A0AAW1Y0M7_RUBAR
MNSLCAILALFSLLLFEVVEFEPRPNVSAYHADIEVAESSEAMPDQRDNGPKAEQPFAEDFEPRPNVSVYND